MFIGALIRHLENLRRDGASGRRHIGCPMQIAKELQQHTVPDIAFQYFDILLALIGVDPPCAHAKGLPN
jgi:hypothetical protein